MDKAEVKGAPLEASRRILAVADSSKLGIVAFGEVCAIERVDILVTDTGADPRLVEQFGGSGVDVQLI